MVFGTVGKRSNRYATRPCALYTTIYYHWVLYLEAFTFVNEINDLNRLNNDNLMVANIFRLYDVAFYYTT